MRMYLAAVMTLGITINTNMQTIAQGSGSIFFVSSLVGSDQNPGTEVKPFATLERARDAIRDLKRKSGRGAAGGVTVFLMGGTYHLTHSFVLTKDDSGTQDAPIIYRAYGTEDVRLSGGLTIPIESFQPVTNDDELSHIDDAAQAHVRRVDLKTTGLRDLTAFHWDRSPPGKPERQAPEELLFDDKPMQLARWPNKGWIQTAAVIDSGSIRENGGATWRPGIIRFDGDRPKRWINTAVWLRGYWKWDWYDESLPVRSIDETNRLIAFAKPSVYGIKAGARYYAFNVLKELDQEGEYYIDRHNAILYFWPPARALTGRALLTKLASPLISLNDASYITIYGLVIEGGRNVGIHIKGGRRNQVVNCTVRNLGKDGIVIDGGQAHEVLDSKIYNLGLRGIVVFGGDRKTLTPAGHSVVGNQIHHYARQVATPYAGVDIDGVGIRVAHNSIHDAPHIGILVAGNDHLIELNDIHNVCAETSDAGVIYTGRDWTVRGNIIRNNFIHDVWGMHNTGDVTAIYLDDLASGTSIVGNILADVYRGVLIGGGRDNTIENNVFANCKLPVSLDARGITWGNKLLSDESVLKKRLGKVPYRTPPWSTRYPQLAEILSDDPALPKRNVVQRNVMYRCGQMGINPVARLYGSIEHNWETDSDPGFVDPAAQNFTIRADSLIQSKLPGWINIPFKEIGRKK